MSKNDFFAYRMNNEIVEKDHRRNANRVILLSLKRDSRPTFGKVSDPIRYFSSFCRVLAQCGISSVFVHGRKNLERELLESNDKSTIVINLIHEESDELDRWDTEEVLSGKTKAIFNSLQTARIIRNKRETNLLLTQNRIPMPSLDPVPGEKVFSNTNIGTHDPVFVYDSAHLADQSRYNTQYIDTRVDFKENSYYSSIRLNCIGSHIVQINVRASSEAGGNPSVTGTDTPLDDELVEFIHNDRIAPRLPDFLLLAEKIESVLGPGFYTHDTLIERDTGKIYLSETGFKFMSAPYANHMSDVIGDRNFLTGVMDIETYAAYAASVFVTYCAGKGFI